jgi:hypothetical protein
MLAERWLWLRVRWRHNPGFVAAAAAGSIGLILALGLVIQGGIRLLSDTAAVDEVEEDSPAVVLGGSAGDGDRGNSVDDPFAEQTAAERSRTRPRHPLNEHPLADEQESPRRVVLIPVEKRIEVDDEADWDDSGDEPAEVVTQPEDQKPVRLKTDAGPFFGDDQPDEADDIDADNSTEPVQRAARAATTPDAGWKHPPSKSPPGVDASAALAEQSRAFETVVYAAPKTRAASSSARSERETDDDERPRLAIEIAGPKTVGVGHMCNIEIRVKNTGTVPAAKFTLSVELPAGLVHEVSQSLEQRVEKLAPGEIYRALLRLRAKAPGRMSLEADVAAQGGATAQSSTTVDVKEAAGTAAKVGLPNCSDLPEMRQSR